MPTIDTTQTAQPFYLWDTPYQLPEQAEANVGIPLDSIFPPRERQAPVVRRSLFTHTTLPTTHDTLQQRHETAPTAWVFVYLVALCGLLFLYNSRHKLHITDLLRSTFDRRAMDRLVRGNNLSGAGLIPMGLFAVSALSLLIYLQAMAHTGFYTCLLVAAALAALYLIRNAVIHFLGNVFEDTDATTAYITSNYIYHNLLAIGLVPLLLLTAYMPWGNDAAFYTAAGLTALCLILRLFRGLKLFLTLSRSHSFYLFYYLCTVELIPLLVAAKWFFAQ